MRLHYGYYGPDRREHKRIVPINRPIDVRMLIGDREIDAVISDLSESGMCVLTNYDVPLKTVLLLKFSLSAGNRWMRPLEITGEVHSNTILKKYKHYLGIAFINISPEDKQEITSFVQYTIKMVKIMAGVALIIILASIIIPLVIISF